MEDQVNNAIKELVLRAISDDYECFERIVEDVRGWAVEREITTDTNGVLSALKTLVSDGCAQAYMLSARPGAKAEAVALSESCLDELWFYVTPTGKDKI